MTILQMVEEFGPYEWDKIAVTLENRTARQCRERWRHYLQPAIDRNPWTADEDALLADEYGRKGPKWSEISQLFPGRTMVNVKNRWTVLRRPEMKRAKLDAKRCLFGPPEMPSPKFHFQRDIAQNRNVQSAQYGSARIVRQTSSPQLLPSIMTLLPEDDNLWSGPSFLDFLSHLP
jgi:hypothetical protein